MISTRNTVIGGWGLGVLLVVSLVAVKPADAGVGFEMLVVGDPTSPIPEPFRTIGGNYTNLRAASLGLSTMLMIAMGGITSDGNTIVITPQCTVTSDPDHNQPKELVQVSLLGALGYQYRVDGLVTKLCDAPSSTINTFTLNINMNAASCLVSGQTGQLEAGVYPVTSTRVTLNLGQWLNDPVGSLPAWRAIKDGTNRNFSVSDISGTADSWSMTAYLIASRPCAPRLGPVFDGVTATKTLNGILGYGGEDAEENPLSDIYQIQAQAFTETISLGSGGAARFQQLQKMDSRDPSTGIVGAKRIQALPLNQGSGSSPYGGYRTDGLFVQCGASNAAGFVTSLVRCRLAGITSPAATIGGSSTASTYGVRVQVGGVTAPDGFNRWSPTGAGGQTVKFRSREVSWAGYGLHSPETTIEMEGDGT